MVSSSFDTPPEIILHFDINKTILFTDPAGGKTLENVINESLGECTWGKVLCENGKAIWKPLSENPTATYPSANDLIDKYPHNDLISYNRFIRVHLHPNIVLPETASAEECHKSNQQTRFKRSAVAAQYTISGPGKRYRPLCEDLLQKMNTIDGQPQEFAPAFFETLDWMNKEFEHRWGLVFRTFGDDLPRLVHEFNSFCEGKHPLYPDIRMDGTNGTPDRRIRPDRDIGVIHRTALAVTPNAGAHLVMGTVAHPPLSMDPASITSWYLQAGVPPHLITQGTVGIHNFLLDRLSQGHTLGLSDHFDFWSAHRECGVAGKLLLLESWPYDSSSDAPVPFHIFFDDNIRHPQALRQIVDVRVAETGASIPFEHCYETVLARVDPLSVLLDTQYFIKILKQKIPFALFRRHVPLKPSLS